MVKVDMTHQYTEQYERVKRYYERFKKIDQGQKHDKATDYHKDDVYAFFQNCYHLKDWIINDPACAGVTPNAEQFINTTHDLQICADICNGTKHLNLKKPRSSENPSFTGQHLKLNIHDGMKSTVELAVAYTISTNSGDIDAFNLATKCLVAWKDYIRSYCP